jgi:replicative DNA helicase
MPQSIENSELHVLYGLIYKPELAKSEYVDPAWFNYRPFATLVDYINKLDSAQGYVLLRNGFEEEHPHAMSREDWEAIQQSDETTASFGPWLHVLKTQYNRNQIKAAALSVVKNPSNANIQAITDAVQTASASAHNDDPGQSPEDYAEYVRRRVENNNIVHGIETYPQLDTMLGGGFMPNMLVTIGARAGVGKSALAGNLVKMAVQKNPGVSIDVFSLEMSSSSVNRRMLSTFSGLPVKSLVNPTLSLNHEQLNYMQTIADQMAAYDYRVFDRLLALPQIVQTIRQRAAAAQHGYMAIVDYLQLVTVPNNGRGAEQRYREVGIITGELKRLTNELEIPIVILSQLNRRVESQEIKRPSLSDLRESGNIEQDSNTVAFLWSLTPLAGDGVEAKQVPAIRDYVLTVAKNRDGELGEVRFSFNAPIMRFLPKL